MKERIHWIDVIKGILILLVVFHHTPFNVKGDFPLWGYKWWNTFIIGFFMPAFFVVTGYCTNFNSSFKSFFLKNIKTILLPSFCLYYFNHWIQDFKLYFLEDADWLTWSHFLSPGIGTYIKDGGYYWFLSALFFAKIVFYGVRLFTSKQIYQLTVLLLLMFVGVICANLHCVANYFFWQQALILSFFLPIGIFLRSYQKFIDKYGGYLSCVYLFSICFFIIWDWKIPSLTRTIDISFNNIPLFIVFSLSGTVTIWWVSQKLRKCSILEYWGKNTIVIYAFNFSVLGLISSILYSIYIPNNLLAHNCLFGLVLVISLAVLTSLAYLFNTNYLRYLLGKF